MYKYARISSEDDDELSKSLLRGKSKSPKDTLDDGKNIPLGSIVVHTEALMTDTVDNSRNIAVDSIAVSSEDGTTARSTTSDHGNIVALKNIIAPDAQRAGGLTGHRRCSFVSLSFCYIYIPFYLLA